MINVDTVYMIQDDKPRDPLIDNLFVVSMFPYM